MKISHFFFVILIGAIAYAALSGDFHQKVAKFSSGFLDRHGSTADKPGPMPMAVSRLASERGESIKEAWVHFDNLMATAPRYRMEGQVFDRLPAGHLLVAATVYAEQRTAVEKKTVALYGYPQQVANGTMIACRISMTGMQNFAKAEGPITTLEEAIYLAEDKPGGWMVKPGRSSLDKKP